MKTKLEEAIESGKQERAKLLEATSKPNRGKAVSARPEVGYPEHEKLRAVSEKSQACGEFLDWLLGEKHYTLGKYHEHTDDCWDNDGELTCRTSTEFMFPAPVPRISKLLAEFFEISEDKLEAEKRAMLDEVRKNQ